MNYNQEEMAYSGKNWIKSGDVKSMRNRMRILEAALEDPDLILKSPWVCLPVVNKTLEYNISNHYRETVEKIMRKAS